jgi:hypothetical protein
LISVVHSVGGSALGYFPVPSVRQPTGDWAETTKAAENIEVKKVAKNHFITVIPIKVYKKHPAKAGIVSEPPANIQCVDRMIFV